MAQLSIPQLSLVVLIGPSGSGKSTFAHQQRFLPTEDYCRGLVSDNENDQAATKDAFEVLQFVAPSRRNIFKRDRFQCQFCGVNPGGEELTIDHVTPRAQGGVSSWTNCVLACVDCNKRKADRTPEQAGMKLRKAPERPAWRPLDADHRIRLASWSKFVSEAYWNVALEK